MKMHFKALRSMVTAEPGMLLNNLMEAAEARHFLGYHPLSRMKY
jgi:hypothetical protein